VPQRPVRIFFHQLTDATARKAQAQSTEADSGGGPMDLRISPYDVVQPFMTRFFVRGPKVPLLRPHCPDLAVRLRASAKEFDQAAQWRLDPLLDDADDTSRHGISREEFFDVLRHVPDVLPR
jgi:hypothetical protein